MSSNGFEDFQEMLKNIKVNDQVIEKSLMAGAEEFNKRLEPKIPTDPNASFAKRYGTMKSNLTTEVDGKNVNATFGDAFWWIFVEHGTSPKGHKGIRATNMVHNTVSQSMASIQEIMIKTAKKGMGI